MTGALITAKLDARQMTAALTRVRALLGSPGPLMRAIGVGLVDAAQARFDKGVDPWGGAWAELSPAYAETKTNMRILVEAGMRGGLLGSLSFRTEGLSVTVGTNRVYGGVHQFGATIRPKSAKALVFRMGDHLVRVGSVTIPARPYLGFGAAEHQVVEDAVGAVLGGALDGLGRARA